MQNKSNSMQVPAGFKDLLPEDAWRKRRLEDTLLTAFQSWGYKEVMTPVVEHYATLATEDGLSDEEIFKLIDRQGKILALRPDMTTPIARVTATRLNSEQLPLRLCYVANVFRHENLQMGRQREFYQGGVELLGASGVMADAETIALAAEALLATGLEDFHIGIGHVAVLNSLLATLQVADFIKDEIKGAIFNKDLVKLDEILTKYNVAQSEREAAIALASLRGGAEVLGKMRALGNGNAAFQDALTAIEELLDVLNKYGILKYCFLDFAIIRDFDYYTGVVFEGYAPGLGFPILGGGRYDNLLSKFGFDTTATGFAIGLERLMIALKKQHKEEDYPILDYVVTGNDASTVIARAGALRSQGYRVEVMVSPKDNIDLSSRAKEIIKVSY